MPSPPHLHNFICVQVSADNSDQSADDDCQHHQDDSADQPDSGVDDIRAAPVIYCQIFQFFSLRRIQVKK